MSFILTGVGRDSGRVGGHARLPSVLSCSAQKTEVDMEGCDRDLRG